MRVICGFGMFYALLVFCPLAAGQELIPLNPSNIGCVEVDDAINCGNVYGSPAPADTSCPSSCEVDPSTHVYSCYSGATEVPAAAEYIEDNWSSAVVSYKQSTNKLVLVQPSPPDHVLCAKFAPCRCGELGGSGVVCVKLVNPSDQKWLILVDWDLQPVQACPVIAPPGAS